MAFCAACYRKNEREDKGMVIMGVDFGDVRTGIAVCDKYEMMARDEPMVKADGFKKTAEAVSERAKELGLTSTKFENTTGLDDTTVAHLTSALDIAAMSRELIKYPKILEYSSLWQDSIRDGTFTLTNTNRLVRYYKGCTGLKTGWTDKA